MTRPHPHPQRLDPEVDAFLHDTLAPFLDFHRPCLSSVDNISATGHIHRRYPQAQATTPCEHFRNLPGAEARLRPGVTFEALDRVTLETPDFEAAQLARRARREIVRIPGLEVEVSVA